MTTSLDQTIVNIEKIDLPGITNEVVEEVIMTLISHDKDMEPLLDIILKLIKSTPDEKDKTYFLTKILKYYGINNTNILATRQKFVIDSGMLVKIPFLKKNQKECLMILLDQLQIKVV
jgi:hypothetical protein